MMDVKVSEGGRIVIPAELRAKHKIAVGDTLIWREDGDELVLSSRRAGIKRAQAIVAKYAKPGAASMVDEFLHERREEQAREDQQDAENAARYGRRPAR